MNTEVKPMLTKAYAKISFVIAKNSISLASGSYQHMSPKMPLSAHLLYFVFVCQRRMLCLDRPVVSLTLCLPATYSAGLRRPFPRIQQLWMARPAATSTSSNSVSPTTPINTSSFPFVSLYYQRQCNHHLISLLLHHSILPLTATSSNTATACSCQF